MLLAIACVCLIISGDSTYVALFEKSSGKAVNGLQPNIFGMVVLCLL